MTRIVLADDDPDILDSTCALLEDEGFDVVPVRRASDILATVAAGADVLLQDVNMPGLDLRGLVETVRQLPKYTPVLLFTAAADAEEQRVACGADDLVGKPFDVIALTDRILVWVARAKTMRAGPI